ncbi:thioredoxin family protein [Winogradskyella sp. A3E31]|uniref:thioredoxin family protein n=1 Tax=Winogradskyella sp. A3E31 TaxID=3349637 RepID=UPI00398A7E13
MNITDVISIQELISESLKTSLTYNEYRALVFELAKKGETTGHEKTEALVNYTMLNDRRMKRWDKTVKISEENEIALKDIESRQTWLVITESWCGDAAHIMPVLNKLATLNSKIEYKVVLRDENEDLMNQFLTNGSKSIPKLLIIDNETKNVIDTYGPRPSEATDMVEAYKEEYGKLTPEFKEDLQRWYNKDKGLTTQNDIIKILKEHN